MIFIIGGLILSSKNISHKRKYVAVGKKEVRQTSFGWIIGSTEPCIWKKDVGDGEKDVRRLEKDFGMEGKDAGVRKKISASSKMIWARCIWC